MQHRQSNRRRGRGAPPVPGPPAPAFVELDPEEAAEYGAFRDDVELEDVLEAGDLPDAGAGRAGHGA